MHYLLHLLFILSKLLLYKLHRVFKYYILSIDVCLYNLDKSHRFSTSHLKCVLHFLNVVAVIESGNCAKDREGAEQIANFHIFKFLIVYFDFSL